jgi:hypothetical protein
MTKELRLISITALTLIIYALSIFFDKGAFLFPFPLNQFIVFAVAAQLAYWHFKSMKPPVILMVLIGVFGTLGNEFYWPILLSDAKMMWFSDTIITDVFQLLHGIAILSLAFLFLIKQKKVSNFILTGVFAIAFVIGLAVSSPVFSCLFFTLSYLTMVISVRINPVYKPIHIFWILLFTLEASKLISIGLLK